MCGEEKEITEFAIEKRNKRDGRRASCKKCTSEKIKKYFKDNPEKKKAFDKEYYEKLREKKLAQKKEYYLRKREEILAKRKEYHKENLDKIKQRQKDYRERRGDELREKIRQYHRKNALLLTRKKEARKLVDDLFAFKERTRMLIKNSFYRLKHNKARRTLDILGADWETVKNHIVSQFTDGMTWEAFVAGDIHIDHIVPLATATCEEDIVRLNHYTNLQPLWALDNLKKGATFESLTKHSL